MAQPQDGGRMEQPQDGGPAGPSDKYAISIPCDNCTSTQQFCITPTGQKTCNRCFIDNLACIRKGNDQINALANALGTPNTPGKSEPRRPRTSATPNSSQSSIGPAIGPGHRCQFCITRHKSCILFAGETTCTQCKDAKKVCGLSSQSPKMPCTVCMSLDIQCFAKAGHNACVYCEQNAMECVLRSTDEKETEDLRKGESKSTQLKTSGFNDLEDAGPSMSSTTPAFGTTPATSMTPATNTAPATGTATASAPGTTASSSRNRKRQKKKNKGGKDDSEGAGPSMSSTISALSTTSLAFAAPGTSATLAMATTPTMTTVPAMPTDPAMPTASASGTAPSSSRNRKRQKKKKAGKDDSENSGSSVSPALAAPATPAMPIAPDTAPATALGTAPITSHQNQKQNIQFSSPATATATATATRASRSTQKKAQRMGESSTSTSTAAEHCTPTPAVRRRIYSPPPGYVPPSLPMIDPNAPAESSKDKGKGKARETVQQPEPQSPNPVLPLASNPALPPILCCNKVRVRPHCVNSLVPGDDIIKSFFKMAGGYYPIDEIRYDPGSDNWSPSTLYLGIYHESDPNRGTDIYAIVNFLDGTVIKMTPISARLPITGSEQSMEERLIRQVGGADFICNTHRKKFGTFFLNYCPADHNYIPPQDDSAYLEQGREMYGLSGEGTDSQGQNLWG